MSKINDNTYTRKIEKEIEDGIFSTKEELIHSLMSNRTFVLNNLFFRQELEDSFIKLNNETLQEMENHLLDFYDKSKNTDFQNLNLYGISSFEVDDKDYIKIQEEDGEILVLDDSLEEDDFVQQFQDRQNHLATNSKSVEYNKQAIIEDLSKDKINVNFSSSLDTSTRDITSETATKDVSVIDDKQEEIITHVEVTMESNFEQMDTSDLEYIHENKLDVMTEKQKQRLAEILKQRRDNQQSLEISKTAEKVFVKKLDNALHTPYNGFVSILFLCSTVSFFGLIFLMLLIIKLNIY